MDRIVEQYIKAHKIKANAMIFRDWEAFLRFLYQHNGRVISILWYEHCQINEQQLGMGGFLDEDCKGCMWAETQIFENNLQEKPLHEILAYIAQIRAEYADCDLYPEFDIQ